MTEPSLPEESIFAQALEIASTVERAAFLDRACGDNQALRAEVEALLRASERSGDLLDLPENPAVTTDLSRAEGAGTVIGPYKLLEQIGEGGMGTVWMAEQTAPIQRRVAVKVVKEGMDSKQVLARFEAERQALALMEHPNIAKVLDAGKTPSGRPYFVMELVKGQPITRYCDEKRLGVRERLDLFGDVCRAVQHAHQKGIIHRDLKPSNVLVAPYDGTPVVKVIDFGVAKATGQRLTDKTLFTGFGAVVGTPEYMSPEQAEVNNQDIDTRSDIYSLGVLLYELLTGSTPLTRKRVKEAALLEVLRVIREEEPPRPSTRLSESKDSLPSISAQRQTEPGKLTKLVRGELDWIVMKALEKDRNRRYESANGFAADIQRYLADESVQACPPSAGYRLRKLARRNRGRLVAAGVLGLALLVAAGGIGWTALDRATRQARAANDLELALERAEWLQGQGKRADALAAFERAELLAGQARADTARDERIAALKERLDAEKRDQEFLARFEDIRLRVASTVDLAESRFTPEAAFPEIKDALGRYGIGIGVLAPTEAAGRVQGRPEPARQNLLAALNECLRWAPSRDAPTRQWLLAALETADDNAWRVRARKAVVGSDRKVLEQMAREADVQKQPPGFLLVVAHSLPGPMQATRLELLRRIQSAYPADLWANHDLALELTTNGQPAEAVRYYTAALALRPDNPGIYLNRGKALKDAGEVDAAIADFRQSVVLAPQYATAHYNLGVALQEKGQRDKAIAAYREAIRLKPNLASAHNNLGTALRDKGQLNEAIAAFREAIRLKPDHAAAHNNLGTALRDKGQLDEAIAECREAIRLKPDLAMAHYALGIALQEKGQVDKAIAAYREAIRLKPDLAWAHNNLGTALRDKGQLNESIAKCREAIRLKPNLVAAHYNLGNALQEKGQLAEAIAAYREAIRLKPDLAWAHINLGNALRKKGQLDEAIAAYREAIRVNKDFPEAHYALGIALREKGQLDKAIAAYREAIRLKKDYSEAHNNLGIALQAKGQLAEAIAAYREAIRIKPENTSAHYNLGNALWEKGKLDEAIAAFREAIHRKKDYAEAHCNLGEVLRQQGLFRQALKEMRRGHELGSRNPRWPYPSAQWVRRCERLVELDGRLPDILAGKIKPASPAEWIELAGLCSLKQRHRATARFYEEAFATDPKLAADPNASHRYNAARAAALAGCGQGKDDPAADPERARLRGQALVWLRGDLKVWRQLLDKESDKARPAVLEQMRHWLRDPDFNGVRGKAIAQLPEAEREPWQKLWDDVADTLARAQARTTSEKKPGTK
jgi:tetratricopeptide (TPR) repeat protein/tRNA A-37 threonylcarbamoyl transferase component Bud32